MPNEAIIAIVAVIGALLLIFLILCLLRYKKCPSDKIMVIYGKVPSDKDGKPRSAICLHGGSAFVVPLLQSYAFLDLAPVSIEIDLYKALTGKKERVNIPARFTVGISTEDGVMQNAAERLLGLKDHDIKELATDIILGQMRLVIATMDFEDIDNERDRFLDALSRNIEAQIRKIGLRLININLTDVILVN